MGMKVKIALFGIFLLLWAAGCGKANVPQIDAYAWTMTTVQGGENGSAVACAPELADSHENAAALELTCKAENGRFILTDHTNNKQYTGEYRLKQTDPQSALYEITIGSQTGHAVTGMTTYLDGSQSPTCILSLDAYTLNFQAEIGTAKE